VIILGDGKVALVEVPVEGYSLPTNEAPLYDRLDTRHGCGFIRAGVPASLLVCGSRLTESYTRAVCVINNRLADHLTTEGILWTT
jgi:hypothetical protein